MDTQELRERVRRELAAASQARSAGNEGKARVCARRAAGWSIIPYMQAQAGPRHAGNAYQNLGWLQKRGSGAPAHLREAAGRLTERIRPDHTLPFDEDPLRDARIIVQHFMDLDLTPAGRERSEGRES
jgi:hypothetical protein